ncbi:VCBS domain-containing protein [Vibrio furnissii]|uniref:VCBS domain-containing protein n=1 Tax=Vibrio furnissii TaxID=29494 RepID=UPI0015598990|nr:VCBS domain-containing protein [Vibrio furnissii]
MSVNSLVFSGILSANQMIVIDVNGNIRTALIGEKLPQGTVIVQRGDDISDEAALKTQIIDANNNPQDITDDVARIFAALEEGQDPTQVDEELAPAAGGGQGSALTAAATVERIGSETIAITSFDTTGFESLGLSQTQSLALSSVLVTNETATSTSVNTAPTIDTVNGSTQTENVGLEGDVVATFNASDVDGDSLTYRITSGNEQGYFEIDADTGVVTLTAAGEAALANDALVTTDYQIGVTVNDGSTDSAEATAVVTFTGANDDSSITLDTGDSATGSVTEDVDTDAETEGVQLEVTGRLSVTDADGDGAFNTTPTFTSSTVEGGAQLGTLTIDAEGNWTYVVDNDNATVQGLNAGETIVETYTVATADGKDTQTITITINGAADDSSITLDTGDSATGSVTEDVDTDAETEGVQLEVTGRLSVTDADGDGAFNTTPTFTSSTVEGGAQLGTLTIDAEGNWTYVVDNDNATVQGLNAGETIVETYTVATADGKDTQTITITINGAADDSSITLDTGDSATGSVTEDVDTDAETEGVQLEVTGRLSVTDADGDGAFNTTPTFTSSTVEGGAQLGTLTIDAEGNWTYVVDNDNATVQGLNAGETIVETYTVATADGKDTQTITITINGAADDSSITLDTGDSATGSVTEDVDTDAETEGVQLEVTGRLSVTDADGDGAFNTTPTFTSSTVEGGAQLGTLTIDAEGNWTYVVDNDNATVQGLNAGETIVETYTVATADGKDTQTITITINGAADDSSITLDTGDSATGSVTEDVDTDAETEGVQLEVTGRLSVTDADGDGAFNTTPTFTSSTVEGGAQLGTLTIDAEGNWTYVVDNDNATVQGLNAGETIVETYTVATADGKDTQTITITINGAADDSSITLDTGDSATGSVTEDVDTDAETEGVQLEVTGRLSVTDADGDGAFNTTPTFTSSTVEGGAQLGTLTIDAEGNWTYVVDNDNATVQGLNAGETIVETYTVATADGKDTQTITITINGAADDSSITLDTGDSATGSVTEDVDTDAETEGVQLEVTGRLSVTDADGDGAFNTTPTFTSSTVEGGAQLGTLTIDAEGNWTYVVDNDNATVQGLNAGETIVETYTVATADGKDTQTITITINGAADDSSITLDTGDSATGSVTEDVDTDAETEGVQLEVTGRLSVTDADGDGAFNTTPTFTSSTVEGGAQLGTLTIDAEGNWTYVVDNDNATVQGLNAGETIVETYTVATADGKDTQTITITINGAADDSSITLDTGDSATGSVTEDVDTDAETEGVQLEVTGA